MLAVTVIIKQDHSSLFLILAPAFAGILGALVGGWTAGRFTLKGEDKRQTFAREMEEKRWKREDDEHAAALRGAARLLKGQLTSFDQAIRLSMETKHWWPRGMAAAPAMPFEDMKVIASSMDAQNWKYVRAAIDVCERVLMRLELEPHPTDPNEALPLHHQGDLDLLQKARELLVAAMKSLDAVA